MALDPMATLEAGPSSQEHMPPSLVVADAPPPLKVAHAPPPLKVARAATPSK